MEERKPTEKEGRNAVSELAGKIALITGGNSGIGLASAKVTLCIAGGQGIALAIEALH
jgi:NAD(P)-dependent dehydrogenase (short-subunit alcohol dehydrogenase family)